jgi:chemotaxis protein MotB
MADNVTIIKRKKAAKSEGHHGGAWKVAYADFVTAMMAFFLLMWLLNATTEAQKKGLADYFDSRIPITQVSGGGTSAFKGDSLTAKEDMAESGGGQAPEIDGHATVEGQIDSDPKGPAPADASAAAEERAFADIQAAFESLSGESDASDELLSHIRTRVTPDGLVIDIFDTDGAPLFETGSATPTPMLRALVEVVSNVAQLVTNHVAVIGHTDSTPFVSGGDDGNWKLSADRAQTARRLMTGAGTDPGRIDKVTGRAATEPMVEDPRDPRNRRVQIILLRQQPTPR